jgi:hypothetical protein
MITLAESSMPYDEGEEHHQEQTPNLERCILLFIISLLDFLVRGWEYESPLVCALAVTALQP